MGQQDIIQFLKEHPNKWYSAKDLKPYGSSTSLMKLRGAKFIDCKTDYDYKVSHISKFYYKYKEGVE